MAYDYKSDAENLKKSLDCRYVGSDIIFLPKVDSTNNLAKEYAKKSNKEGLVIVADSQSGGRGRTGKSWHSPPETGVYLSVILKPDIKPEYLSFITLVAGVSAASTINEFCHRKANLKWPNDVLINNKKVCGLLCEMTQKQESCLSVIVGIGINANQMMEQFPEDLKNKATSLKMVNGSSTNRLTLIRSLLTNLDREYHLFLAEGGLSVIEKWRLNTDLFGRIVSIKRGSSVTTGKAMRLDELGRLILLLKNGEEEPFDSGEITPSQY